MLLLRMYRGKKCFSLNAYKRAEAQDGLAGGCRNFFLPGLGFFQLDFGCFWRFCAIFHGVKWGRAKTREFCLFKTFIYLIAVVNAAIRMCGIVTTE
jgi:hypothetical protein